MKKPTPTQRKILESAAGIKNHRPSGRSQSGGWSGATVTCHKNGWLDKHGITDAGREAIGLPPLPRARVAGGLRRVISSTVKVDGHTYGSPALVDGDDVFVRLDPDRPGLADIYSADREQLIGVAFCPELIPERGAM